jgi:hypothetical protein
MPLNVKDILIRVNTIGAKSQPSFAMVGSIYYYIPTGWGEERFAVLIGTSNCASASKKALLTP